MIAESRFAGTRPLPDSLVAGEVKRLAHQSSHYVAGLMGGFLIGFVSFPIFTRVFSVAEYGLMDLAQKLMLMLVPTAKMGLQNAALRFFDGRRFASDREAARRYYSTMYFGALATSAVIAAALIGLFPIVGASWAGGKLTRLVPFIAALIVLRAVGSILWAFLRIEERTRAYNVAIVVTRAATVAAVCALLPVAGRTARTYLQGMALAEAAVIACVTAWLLRRRVLAPMRCDFTLFRTGMAFGMPLVVYEAAFTFLGSADRFLVQHYLGPNALGFYSVAYALSQHVNDLLVTPLNLALMPIYLRIWTSGGREQTVGFLNVTLDYFLLASAGTLAIAAACARDIVAVLASSKYAGAERLVPLLLAGLLVYTLHAFLAAGLFIHNRTLKMAGILLGAAALNIGLNCLLLPTLGLAGGAVAVLASYFVCSLALGLASNRYLPLRIECRRLGKYAGAAALAWLAASSIGIDNHVVSFAARSGAALAVYASALLAIDVRMRNGAGLLWRRLGFNARAGN
jgi:O-antigen/teichoic acid export membrane protein